MDYAALAKILVAGLLSGGSAAAGVAANTLIDRLLGKPATAGHTRGLLGEVAAGLAALAQSENVQPDVLRIAADNAAARMRSRGPRPEHVSAAGFDRDLAARKYADFASPDKHSGEYLGEPEESVCRRAMGIAFGAWAGRPEAIAAIEVEFQRKGWSLLETIRQGLQKATDLVRSIPQRTLEAQQERKAQRLLHIPRQTWNPADNLSTSVLLRADYHVVPFLPRDDWPQRLVDWAQQDDLVLIRALYAPGGTGKTRLLLHVAETLRDQHGWQCSFPSGPRFVNQADPTQEEWAALLDVAKDLLVVLDYAGGRRRTLTALLQAWSGQCRRLRIVLADRDAGAWWGQLKDDSVTAPHIAGPATPEPEPLPPVPAGLPRAALFRAAAVAYAHPDRLGGEPNPPPPAGLDSDADFARPLYVVMAAYAAVQGRPIASAQDALHEVYVHERETWKRQLDLRQTPADDLVLRAAAQLAAMLTLAGAVPAGSQGRRWIARLPAVGSRRGDLGHRLHNAFRALYPGNALAGLQPDILGEHVVWSILAGDKDDWREIIQAALPRDATPKQVGQAVTVLARLTARPAQTAARNGEGPQPRAVWIEFAMEMLCPRAKASNDPAWIQQLVAELDPATDAVQPLRIVALKRHLHFLERRPDCGSVPVRQDVAGYTSDLGEAFGRRGDHETALRYSTAAVAAFAELEAQTGDPRHRGWRAMSLNNRSNRLSALGRHDEALDDVTGAVDIYRELVQRLPERYRPELAMSLTNRSAGLSALGRHDEALADVTEALAIRRELAQRLPERYRPDLAMSLNNRSNRLSALGRHGEALADVTESVEIRRELAQRLPERYRPDLAMSLNNRSNRLSALGRHGEALADVTEAVDFYRELTQRLPERYRSDLAGSLNNRCGELSELGRHGEALADVTEAVDIFRELAQRLPERYRPDLASSLNNRSNMLSALGRHDEALDDATEAVDIYRELAQRLPERYRPDLAMSLGARGAVQRAAGALEGAREAFREGVLTLEPSFRASPQAHVRVMMALMRDYNGACKATGVPPDEQGLQPILRALAEMQQQAKADSGQSPAGDTPPSDPA